MLPQYNINAEYAKKCLEANKHNDITTTYYLLVKKYLTQGKKGIVDPNCSFDTKNLNKSMPRIDPEKKLNESMRVDNNKSCNMNESFENQRKVTTAYQSHMASALGYSSTTKAKSKNPVPSVSKETKNTSFINEDDSISSKKKSDFIQFKKNAPLEFLMQQRQKRGSTNNRRNISCRDKKDPNDIPPNKAPMQYNEESSKNKSTRSGKQDWSYELLTGFSGGQNLQRIFDLYQQQECSIPKEAMTAYMDFPSNSLKNGKNTNIIPKKALDEDLLNPNYQAQQIATRANHRVETTQGKRKVAKSSSPAHNAHMDTEIKTNTRSSAAKKTKECNKTVVTDQTPETKNKGGSDELKKEQPITIIQAPQINNINNYNNIHIGSISIKPPDTVQPAPPAHAPVPPPAVNRVNNFRMRKYKVANNNDIKDIAKEAHE